MKPTEFLMEEHEAIKQMLKILNKICDKLQSEEQVDGSHLEQIVDFIRNFADKCHHSKEEDILFVAMGEAGFLKEAGPISVMLTEHDMGRDLVKGFSDAVERYKEGDSNAATAIVGNARKYVALLDEHIDKENNILYPMADAHLTQEQQKNMLQEFEKLEQQKIGPGKHEEYHILLNDLKVRYLD